MGLGGTNSLTTKVTMKENKLGRKYANTWSPQTGLGVKGTTILLQEGQTKVYVRMPN